MNASSLLAAVAESIITKRPMAPVAKHFGVEPAELHKALFDFNPFTFRGQLEIALASPHDRPDLLSTKTHLARLEEHYANLIEQFDRAESRCRFIMNKKEGYNDNELMKAEIHSNKIHKQIMSLLKDLRKTELDLKKAEKPAAESASGGRKSSEKESTTSTVAIPSSPSPAPDTQPPTPTATIPTPEEFQRIILKYRHQIKDASAKDRPALIARLIEQHRNSQKPEPEPEPPAQPSQNGKHAA
jgi:hypothetical protein